MPCLWQPWRAWTALLLALLSGLSASAQETNAPARLDYPSFKIITERNIFNARRSGRRDRESREPQRQTRVESFSLLGTLSYEKGRFAFFDGTSSDLRKVLQPEGTIAGYKLAEIAPKGVKLEANGKQVELRVGKQMRREEDGEWLLAEGGGPYPSSAGRADSSTNSTVSSAASETKGGSSGDVSDVLKRLMEKREQELK